MTEKELKKLTRAELLEMLIAQSKKLSRTETELAAAQEKLKRREIAISESGTVAEAALKLSGIFDDADRAVAQYRESVLENQKKAEDIINAARVKAAVILKMARAQGRYIVESSEKEAKERVKALYGRLAKSAEQKENN